MRYEISLAPPPTAVLTEVINAYDGQSSADCRRRLARMQREAQHDRLPARSGGDGLGEREPPRRDGRGGPVRAAKEAR